MRIVLDTNVVVSALIWVGHSYELLRAAIEGGLTLCTSPELLAELRDVLARPHVASRLEQQRSTVEEAVALYQTLTINVSPLSTPRVVTDDADDDHVVAVAVAAQAGLIVSGDRHLLILGQHLGVRIVTPAAAMRLIAGN